MPTEQGQQFPPQRQKQPGKEAQMTPRPKSTFPEEKVEQFGADMKRERAGQPVEISHSYVFLASEGGSYMTGQVLHPNGGTIVGG